MKPLWRILGPILGWQYVEESGSKAIASSAELDLCICCVDELVMEFSKSLLRQ